MPYRQEKAGAGVDDDVDADAMAIGDLRRLLETYIKVTSLGILYSLGNYRVCNITAHNNA